MYIFHVYLVNKIVVTKNFTTTKYIMVCKYSNISRMHTWLNTR